MLFIFKNNLINATRCGKLLYSEMNTYLQKINSVKTSLTRGQSAWVLNNPSETQRSAFSTKCKNSNRDNFKNWLVGFTDGDGDFSFYKSKDKDVWNFTFKISQNRYNLRVLYYIKSNLKIGKVTVVNKDNMGYYRIRNCDHLMTHIIPLFEEHPLVTTKYFKYYLFKKALLIARNHELSTVEKNRKLTKLLEAYKKLPVNILSPVWNNVLKSNLSNLKSVTDAKRVVNKFWLIGFTEAEGSFYLVKERPKRLAHSFAITQKHDFIVIVAISLILGLHAKQKKTYNTAIAQNLTAIESIIDFFFKTMKGMKSYEYRIWSRSFKKRKRGFDYLYKIQKQMRNIKSIRFDNNLERENETKSSSLTLKMKV